MVLSGNGTILRQGPFEKLRDNEDGYIKDLISHEDPTEIQEESPSIDKVPAKSQQSESDDTTRQVGDANVYLYFANSVGWKYSVLFIFMAALYTFSSELQAVLLELWAASESKHPGLYTNKYMGLYAMLSVLALCGIGGFLSVTLLFAGPSASIKLHRMLLHAVFAAPYSWFVATDSGVTLNR